MINNYGEYCFFSPSDNTIIDSLGKDEQRTLIEGETEEQVRKRYPDAIRIKFDEAWAIKEEAGITEPEEISEEEFDYLLNVLPPIGHWWSYDSECFKMSERTFGKITTICVRLGNKHFKFSDRCTLSIVEILDKVQKIHYSN
ncbi:MAG: DUF1419 domain-containing protein [Xenococcaceae cyanobacterium MO_167.B27]|nr:DUF1419 domain-containing protein [Xenococcaceae cyanobacterium MO_167.B27]